MSELSAWLDKLSATAIRRAEHREYRPRAFFKFQGGIVRDIDLAGAGDDFVYTMRCAVVITEPTHAALVTEAWYADMKADTDDPDLRRVAMGELTPSTLPRSKRREVLVMYGEEAATGEHETRFWIIENDPKTKKRLPLKTYGQPDGTTEVSRFWPIFVVEHELRRFETDGDIPDEMRLVFRKAGEAFGPEKRADLMRRAWAELLVLGYGSSSRAFEDQISEVHRAAISKIVKSGIPARSPT